MALLSWQWLDGVFTLRLELFAPKPKKKKLGAKPRPPPFPLPPFRYAVTSWLEIEPTAPSPQFRPEPTVIVMDPAQTLDG